MQNYPVKILIAFGEALGNNQEIHLWLAKNGYQELRAISLLGGGGG